MKLPDVNVLLYAANEASSDQTAGNLTSDAHLAALAIEHGATLGSFDADFERFSGLRFDALGAAA